MRASLEKQPNNLDLFFKTVGGDNCNMATLCQIGELNHTYVLSLSFRISFKKNELLDYHNLLLNIKGDLMSTH